MRRAFANAFTRFALGLVCLGVAITITGCGSTGSIGGGGGQSSAPTASITASPNPAIIGQTITLTVSTTNVTGTCTGTGLLSGTITCNGSIPVTPTAAGSYTYGITAPGGSGTTPASASVTVAVNPVPTVTISANPATITSGNSSTLTIATTNATSCTIPGISGVAPNSSITVTPTATTTYPVTCTGPGGSATASATITVTAPVPSIKVTCTPQAITTADTSQCAATYQNLSSGVTWTASGGATITVAGVFTPNAAGTFTITATSTQAGYTTVSGQATITVTVAVPVITGSNLASIYADAEAGLIGGIQLNGSGIQNTDTISCTPAGILQGASYVNSTQVSIILGIDTPHTSPGFISCTITSPDGTVSTSYSIPFFGNQNLLVLAASGELYYLDEGAGFLRQYKADGTADGTSPGEDTESSITTDEKTGYVILNTRSPGDNTFNVLGIESLGNGYSGVALAARNGYGCLTQASGVNYLSCVDLTLSASSNPSLNSITIGNQPWSLDMGLFGTETDALAFSRNDTSLWKINVSGGMILKGSQQIPGITPYATLQASNPLAGGWHVVVFDSGPAAGTVAMLSTADKLLTFLNASTMSITKQITLTGIPFRMAKDLTNGNVVIGVVDQANTRTTFVAVNATTGAITQLTSTTPTGLLAVGLQISAGGKNIDACQRSQCVVLSNK